MTSKPYYENEPISADRIIEIIHDIFNSDPDQVAIALQILKEEKKKRTNLNNDPTTTTTNATTTSR